VQVCRKCEAKVQLVQSVQEVRSCEAQVLRCEAQVLRVQGILNLLSILRLANAQIHPETDK
jgi:hypothetical protein